MSETFDEDYYERGLETGKSCYQNYTWLPELTIAMTMTLIDFLGIKRGQKVLDFGCAKGYVVKALRLLHREAYGCDISKYAIENVDESVKKYCKEEPQGRFEYIIAKDVFEHILIEDLRITLKFLSQISPKMFVIVPLGSNSKYNSSKNDLDITHVICNNEVWWKDLFEVNWYVDDFRFKVPGIKDSYYEKSPEAHGFFTLFCR